MTAAELAELARLEAVKPGRVFGKLTVQKILRLNHYGIPVLLCACECGGERTISASEIVQGLVKSCGCLRYKGRKPTHGLSKTQEYKIWHDIRKRCLNSRHKFFHRYGGRGITICERWSEASAFIADMGPRPSPKHSIDRIDNDGNYEPGNCRWATSVEQAKDCRSLDPETVRRLRVKYRNKTLGSIREAASRLGVSREVLSLALRGVNYRWVD